MMLAGVRIAVCADLFHVNQPTNIQHSAFLSCTQQTNGMHHVHALFFLKENMKEWNAACPHTFFLEKLKNMQYTKTRKNA